MENYKKRKTSIFKLKISTIITVFIALFLFNCNPDVSKVDNEKNELIQIDSISNDTIELDRFKALKDLKIDTSTLEGKRKYILEYVAIENGATEYDTLVDLNYDGNNDYVIGVYGQCGTGFKNGVVVYLLNTNADCYIKDTVITGLPNPTFYLKQKKITSFYLGGGGGAGERLELINGIWVVTKRFNVSNDTENTIWEIEYPLKGKKEVYRHSYQMLPPENVLEYELYDSEMKVNNIFK